MAGSRTKTKTLHGMRQNMQLYESEGGAMNRETFERILTEEGIDDEDLRAELWCSRPPGFDDNEERLRNAAKKFNK